MTKLPDYLQELAELEKKATPGPWEFNHVPCTQSENARLVSAARNAIQRILSDFQKLLDERAEMIKVLEFYGDEDHYWESHNGASNIRTVDQGHKARAMLDKLKGTDSESQ